MNKKAKRIGAGLAGAAALGLATFGVVQLSPIGAASAADTSGVLTAKSAASVSPVFARVQTAADQLPAFLQNGPQAVDGMAIDSTRLLGEVDGTKAWAALNNEGQACLISLLPGDEQWASATCSSPGDFASRGIGLQAATVDESARLYFVPSGYGAAPGLATVGTQLLSSDAHVTQTTGPVLKKTTSGSTTQSTARSTGESKPATIELLPFKSVEDLSK